MDQAMFFHQVDREQAEIDFVNSELQILADEAIAEAQYDAYLEFVDAQLCEFYDEVFPDSEWDI